MRFISREQWGARRPRAVTRVAAAQRTHVTAHYTTGQELGRADTAEWVRSIQRFHMDGQGWSDIGYNYLIDREGRVFEGRGWDVQGAHARGANTSGIGVAFLGNDDPGVQDVTPAARAAFVELYGWLHARTRRQLDRNGHRDVNDTACPGDELYKWWTGKALTVPKPKPKPKSKGYPSGTGPWPSSWTLKRGDRGPRVAQLQAALMAVFPAYASNLGSKSSPTRPDGSYGPATEAAVEEFQRRAGVKVDGKVGPQTTRRLQDYGINLPTPRGWQR